VSADESSSVAGALERALGLLARRPLSERELRERLGRRGHASDAVDAACRRLVELGYLDDRKLAAEFIATRALRLGHAPGRLLDDLVARGVERAIARSALDEALARGELSEVELLRRRLRRLLAGAAQPRSRNEFRRVYNALRRAGFTEESILREIDPDLPDATTTDEAIDDFP